MRPILRGTALLVAPFALAGLVWIAGASSPSGASKPGAVQVSERDFRIKTEHSVAAGAVTMVVTNHGPDLHELIVVRDPGGALPMRPDGLTVDEDAIESETVASLEPAQPGQVRTLHLHLRRGRYTLFCNMTGHDLGGMHTRLVVR